MIYQRQPYGDRGAHRADVMILPPPILLRKMAPFREYRKTTQLALRAEFTLPNETKKLGDLRALSC